MDIEKLRKFCLLLPNVTEDIKWEHDLCFLIGNKMFCVCGLEPTNDWHFSFKCTPEKFAELVEIDGIIPAPYVARYHWVAVHKPTSLDDGELKNLISNSYSMVFEKLPAKIKSELKK